MYSGKSRRKRKRKGMLRGLFYDDFDQPLTDIRCTPVRVTNENENKTNEPGSSRTNEPSKPNESSDVRKTYKLSKSSSSCSLAPPPKTYKLKRVQSRTIEDVPKVHASETNLEGSDEEEPAGRALTEIALENASNSSVQLETTEVELATNDLEENDTNKNDNEELSLQYDDHSPNSIEDTNKTLSTFSDEILEPVKLVKIPINPCSSYEMEIRKAKAVVAIDDHFFRIILPDFDVKKYSLMKRKYVLIRRKCVFNEEGSIRWLYGCSCNPFLQDFINSLSLDTDCVQEEKDLCIHIKVSRILIGELDSWEENEDPLDFMDTDISSQVSEVNDIAFSKDTVLVTTEGSVAAVTFDGTRFFCCICENSYCVHCAYLKIKKNRGDDVPEYLDNLFKKTKIHQLSKTKQSISWKRIPFHIDNPETMKPPCNYLPKAGEDYVCEDKDVTCYFCSNETLWEISSFKMSTLFCKGYPLTCKVMNKRCLSCNKEVPYDGLSQSILNMGKFLIHHGVLRDYMFHFLHGNSCTLHSYYEVMCALHKDGGNVNFSKNILYNDFRCAWYAYTKLLNVSFEENFECDICGMVPDIIVCDATSMGYQRKFLTAALSDSRQSTCYQRYSQHEDRVAIPDVKLRQDFKKWTEGKLNKPSTNKLKAEMRKKCIVIFNVMKWSIDVFLEVNLFPRSLRNVLQLLSSVSPVCSYFEPSEEAIALALKMLEPNVKADSEVMKSIQLQFPLFHDLLSSLTIEASLPDIWKGVILYLSDKACQPFNVANIINTPNCDSTNEIGSFPNLPPIRKRGFYAQDLVSAKEKECRKNHAGHPNLTSGIFTIYCQHGICFGFQVMNQNESPNIPFTIFRTRFQKAPKVIIYDNACNLHTYALNRDPLFFRYTKFVVDRFHWKNHTACSLGYCMSKYPVFQSINSEVNEQENAKIKKLKTQLSYMTPENFLSHCKLFFWFRNKKNKAKRANLKENDVLVHH